MNNEIILFEDQDVKLEVSLKDETVWLNQNSIAKLFGVARSTITDHINNILISGELEEKTSVGISDESSGGRKPKLYNLDMIIAVGYRVNSKKATIFRRWATNILKEYLIKGYSINKKRLEYLEKTVQLIDVASRIENDIDVSDAKEVIHVINSYSKAFDLLDKYDHKQIIKPKGTIDLARITYDDCKSIIQTLEFNKTSNIFGLERDKGLESIINNIYQSFDKKDLYESVEEKAANLLYLTIKNHPFIDGNKRIAATIFIYFLSFYKLLYDSNRLNIDNKTLVALTLLIAESNPKEKEIMIDLVMNLLINN